MKIDKIDIFQLDIPYIRAFKTASTTHSVRGVVLVRLGSEGVFGWGESSVGKNPHYSAEYADGVFSVCRDVLTPLVLGESISSGEELTARFSAIKGNFCAKAAFDHAFWDLSARLNGKSLTQQVGAAETDVVAGADLGVEDSIETLLDLVKEQVDVGIPRIKLKCCRGWDIEPIKAVRQAYPDLTIHVDCNSGYRIKDIELFKELDDYGLAMIEQPLQHDDLIDHAKLQQAITTPICLDETVVSPTKALQAAEIGACRWINIKPPRVGGLTNSLEVLSICKEHGIKTWVGSMFETSIGQALCIALQRAGANNYPMDLFDSHILYGLDVGTGLSVLPGGKAVVPTASGIGFDPELGKIEPLCVNKFSTPTK